MTLDLNAIRARAAAASPGPWESQANGNQYVNTSHLPTARLVAASRVKGLVRPWNPHAYIAFGFKPEEFETARFLDEDAEFVAHAREDIPDLLAEVERLRTVLSQIRDYFPSDGDAVQAVAVMGHLAAIALEDGE